MNLTARQTLKLDHRMAAPNRWAKSVYDCLVFTGKIDWLITGRPGLPCSPGDPGAPWIPGVPGIPTTPDRPRSPFSPRFPYKHTARLTEHPTRHNIGHFGDVLPSQSLGFVVKKLNATQTNQTKQTKTDSSSRKITQILNLNRINTKKRKHDNAVN